MSLAEDVDFTVLAKETRNYSGADLINLCNETALEKLVQDRNAHQLCAQDFLTTLSKLKPSLTRSQLEWYENYHSNQDI